MPGTQQASSSSQESHQDGADPQKPNDKPL